MSTNLPAMPAYIANMMPTLPQAMREQLAAAFAPALDSFGSAFNRISLKGSRFHLISGGQVTHTFNEAFTFVIVAISPEQHCVWYKNGYNGEEGVEPDAVWAQNEEPPANVPMSARVKDASGRNQYSMRRRFIVAPYMVNPQGNPYVDLDNLYVWDAGGMTTFGDDVQLGSGPYPKAHSFSTYMNMCKSSGFYPCAILTTAIFDLRQSVPVARFLPVCSQQGTPAILDMDTLQRVIEKSVDPTTQQLLDWRRGRSAEQQRQDVGTPVAQQQRQDVGTPVAQQQRQDVGTPVAQQQRQDVGTPVAQQPVQQTYQQSYQPAPQQPVLQENSTPVYQEPQSGTQSFMDEFANSPTLDGVVTQTTSPEAGHVDTVASDSTLAGVVKKMSSAVDEANQTKQELVQEVVQSQPQQQQLPEQTDATAEDLVARMNDIMNTF
ncbi:hypothetical protein BvCmsKSNP013_03554 [Escherichia coli]|uniref:hypothetical protein n=1 Tax=Escherichia coli TaxID=562 RepID=UPI0010CB3B07|nr:hypothetical protein [Escherichia coli]GDI38976.1 hypothetical protein BvCmsKSNP013_03554 [Escherichia coli]